MPLITDEDVQAVASRPVLPQVDEAEFQNPTKELQEEFVGDSFATAYGSAAHFLNYVDHWAFQGRSVGKVLDYGCGWGRMLRLLRRKPQLESVELFGCDIYVPALETIRRSVPKVWLTRCDPDPPTMYRDGSFDVIYAFSVFSHLNEESHMNWAREFARILRPGGRVVLTTQGLKFLKMAREYREGVRPISQAWHQAIANAFPDVAEQRYGAGEFLYAATYSPTSKYGEAAVPRSYFETRWKQLGFSLLDWNEDFGQNWLTLERSG